MSDGDNEPVVQEVNAPLDAAWASMTFPAYRHLLACVGTGESTLTGHRPLACIATLGGTPVGLALAQQAPAIPPTVEVLSLFVAPAFRGQGIATRLLAGVEDFASRAGAIELSGTYMTGSPSVPAVERVLAKREFDPPVLRRIIFKFSPENAAECRWFKQARMPADASIFKWAELTREELAWLKQSQAERQWIHPKLEPWNWDLNFDPETSFGMRKDGEVVGWVINHRLSPGVVTFTTAFMRSDLARRGASFPLYVASLMPLMGSGVLCVFMTDPAEFHSMARFMLKRGSPFAQSTVETRGVSKRLL